MVRFAEVFPDLQIVQAVPAQLSWTHLVEIIRRDDPLKRDFFTEMCRIERWSTRTLEKKIGGMLFERTALSKKPAKLAEMELKQLREEDKLTPDLVFRDPYFGQYDHDGSQNSHSILKKRTISFWIFWGLGLHFLFVAKTFVDVIQILPKTRVVDTDAVIVLDALRKQHNFIDYSGDTVSDALRKPEQ